MALKISWNSAISRVRELIITQSPLLKYIKAHHCWAFHLILWGFFAYSVSSPEVDFTCFLYASTTTFLSCCCLVYFAGIVLERQRAFIIRSHASLQKEDSTYIHLYWLTKPRMWIHHHTAFLNHWSVMWCDENLWPRLATSSSNPWWQLFQSRHRQYSITLFLAEIFMYDAIILDTDKDVRGSTATQ